MAKWPQNGYNKDPSFEIKAILYADNQLQFKHLHTEPAIGFEPMTC